MKPLCIFHKADLDGVCSAAIVKHFVPECELYGWDYGMDFAWNLIMDKRTVYMVDCSLPPEDMKRLAETCNLVYLDHHKTALDAMKSAGLLTFKGICTPDRAACEIVWLYFNDTAPIPEAVRLLGTYDSWRSDDPEWETKVLPFQWGMRAQEDVMNPNSKIWLDLITGIPQTLADLGSIRLLGRAILRYQATKNRSACEAGCHEVCIVPHGIGDPYKVSVTAIACNTTEFNSQFFAGFYDPEKHDCMAAYMQLATGKWKVSLYSTKPEIDCGAICKAFGGGGHPGAAGFICDKLPWSNQ